MKVLMFAALPGLMAACAIADGPRNSAACPMQSLEDVFLSPTDWNGRRFCGWVRAIPEDRSIKLFPSEEGLPSVRNDLVMIVERQTERLFKNGLKQNKQSLVYVEGKIETKLRCFNDKTIDCIPYHRPLTIELSRVEFPD